MKLKLYNFFHRKNKIDIQEFLEKYVKEQNGYRMFHYYLQMLNWYLYSKGYNLYRLRLYKKSEDVGKENSKQMVYYEKIKLLEPINVVFGNYDTFEYFYKLIMLEQYSSRIICVPTSATNHDIANVLFMETLNDFVIKKTEKERR